MKEEMEIPEGWVVERIGTIAILNPALPNKDDIDNDIEVQFLSMKLVQEKSNKIHLTETRQFRDVLKGSYTSFINEDIIFAKVTPCMENGKIAIVNKLANGIGFGSSEFHILRTSTAVLNKYLYYFIGNDRFRNEAKRAMTGAVGLRRVPKQFIEEYQFPLPPLPEQYRIVAKIEELFSSLDKGIESLKTARAQLKVYRQAVLKWAFEGKLTNEGVKEGELPKGWAWKKVEDVGKVQLGRQRSPKHVSKDYPTKYIRAANITENGFDLSDILEMEFTPNDFIRYKLQQGDILLSEASGSASQVGKPAIWQDKIDNCCFQNTVIRLRPYEQYSGEYLLCLFKSFYHSGKFAKIVGGVGINHLGANKFSAIEIPIPPTFTEQNLIVSEIESRLSVCDKIEESISVSLLQAEALRQSILKKAFEGKLVPQDPGDEPAGVLLGRIRGERAQVEKQGKGKKAVG